MEGCRKAAIIQSNYIPWKGYFDIINKADEFIIYDHVQYTKNDWRNRNKIKTHQGIQWFTIPVNGSVSQKICEVFVFNNSWRRKHWSTLMQEYGKSPFFKDYKDIFEKLYLGSNEENLSKINYEFIKAVNEILGIKARITHSMDYNLVGDKVEKLVEICTKVNANTYISGPSAKSYLNEQIFNESGIQVEWMEYENYPEYNQLYPPFYHAVSILDLIFNEGLNAVNFMKSFNKMKQL